MAKKTLQQYADDEADKLIAKWADRNKTVVWLGAKSRTLIKSEVSEAIKSAYKLAKDK